VEQCRGLVLPEIQFQNDTKSLPKNAIQNIVLDTVGKERYLREFSDIQDIGLWVGPEGGWSEEERQEMI